MVSCAHSVPVASIKQAHQLIRLQVPLAAPQSEVALHAHVHQYMHHKHHRHHDLQQLHGSSAFSRRSQASPSLAALASPKGGQLWPSGRRAQAEASSLLGLLLQLLLLL